MGKIVIGPGAKAIKKNIADINNDGVVDEKDLSIVHKEYQKAKKAKKAAPKKKVAAKKPVAKKAAAKPAAKRGRPAKKK